MTPLDNMPAIVLFDGECLFCQGCVRFIVKHEKHPEIMFAPLQSAVGSQLKRQHRIADSIDSMMLIESGEAYIKSTAALRVCRYLRMPWRWLTVFLWLPAGFRNLFYDAFGRRRYAWFGRDEQCMVPNQALKSRFIDDESVTELGDSIR